MDRNYHCSLIGGLTDLSAEGEACDAIRSLTEHGVVIVPTEGGKHQGLEI